MNGWFQIFHGCTLCLFLSLWILRIRTVYALPQFNSFDKVEVLSETVTSNTILSTIDCTDTGGLPVSVSIQTVNPTSPCTNCFQVLACGTNSCLQYRAGIGTLRASAASSYSITVECDNSLDIPATELIYIIISPNQPPYFDPDDSQVETINVGTSRLITAGSSLYQVDAIDDDPDDTVEFFMSTFPSEYDSSFTIGSADGIIRPTVDMVTVCTGELTFEVYIFDGENLVGPKVIVFDLRYPNVAAVIANLNNEIHIPEDATGTVFTIVRVDRNALDDRYTFSSSNTAGLAQYTIDGSSKSIGVATTLNYEDPSLRETAIDIVWDDGGCTSDPYTLRLVVKDINEAPVITPVTSSFSVCEGEASFDPGLSVTDEDLGDSIRWSLHSTMTNGDAFFNIEPNSGHFLVNPDYDVDQGRRNPNIRYVVQAVDRGGLSATATVNVEFLDCNDNAPVFNQPSYSFTTTACTASGTNLGTVAASDDDSARENNNVITYSGSGGAVSVNLAGEVILQSPLAAGSVLTFNGLATDQGQTPGPLTSIEPARISIIFQECPTTAPPTTAAPATTAAPGTTAAPVTTTTLAPNSASLNAELPWIIVAAISGAIFLGLFSLMCWKFGGLFRCPSCNRPSCNPCRKKTRPRKIERRGPHQKPPSPLPPVEKPGPGFIFGFWKERFPDNDFKKQPDRRAMPETGNLDPVYPHTIDPIDDPETSGTPEPEKRKRRCCTIL